MTRNKKIIIPAVALAILLGAGAYGINGSYANEDSSRKSIVDKLVSKFNLNKDDVQKLFNEERETMQKEMEERFAVILNEAVASGKLTEAQKTLIIDKKAEIKANFQANKDKFKNQDRKEMQAQMKSERESLEKWANDNGIDMKYLIKINGRNGERGGKYRPNINR